MPPSECNKNCDWNENSRLILVGLNELQGRTSQLEQRVAEMCERQRTWADDAHRRLEEVCRTRHDANSLRFEKLDRDAREGLVKLRVWGTTIVLVAGALCSAVASWVFSLLE